MSHRKKRANKDDRSRRREAVAPRPLEFDAVAVLVIAVGLALGVAGAAWEVSFAVATPASDPETGGGGHSHGGPLPSASDPGAAPAFVASLGVGVAILGLRRWLEMRLLYRGGAAILAASSLLLADGIVHLYAAADHVSHFPLFVFFVASGIGLLVVGFLVLWERPASAFLAIVGIGALIAIYFGSRVFTPPFLSQPEPFEAVGAVSKAIEFAALAPLYAMFAADVRSTSREPFGAKARAKSRNKMRLPSKRSGGSRPGGETPGPSVRENPRSKGPRRSGMSDRQSE